MAEENTTTNTRWKNKTIKIAIFAIIIIIAIVGTILGIYYGIKSLSDTKTAAEDGQKVKKEEVKKDEEI